MFLLPRKSVLLVDFDNIVSCYGRPLLDNIPNWVKWLEHGQFDPKRRRRHFVVKRAYWNSENDTHRPVFQKNHFEVQLCRAIRKEKASSADFDITIQAVQLRYKHRDIKEVIILSFDTDFSSVLLHLQLEHRIGGVSMIDSERLENFRDTATSKYQRLLDLSIDKEAFKEALSYSPSKKKRRPQLSKPMLLPQPITVAPAAQPAPAPSAKPSQPKFDYAAAAGIIAETAERNGLVYIGKDRIRTIIGHLPGFTTPVGMPWAGGSYRRALNEFVRVHPDKFALEKSSNNGGVVLAYRGNGRPANNGRNGAAAGNGAARQPPAA